jgi:AraC-like DNA-binding protein
MTNVTIDFKEPCKELKPYIRHYVFTEVNSEEIPAKNLNHRIIVIPDGEIELHIGYQNTTASFEFNHEGPSTLRSALVGTNSVGNAAVINGLKRYHKCLIIKFKPLGFYCLTGLPLSSFSNKIVDAELVFGKRLSQLCNQLDQPVDNSIRCRFVEDFLSNLRADSNLNPRSVLRIKCAINSIFESNGQIELSRLLSSLNISERPLQRDFQKFVGHTPLQMCKIFRFQKTLNMMDSQIQANGYDLFYKNGYYDQSHLIHDFKETTTLTPMSYIKHKDKGIYRNYNTIILPDRQHHREDNLCVSIISTALFNYKSCRF